MSRVGGNGALLGGRVREANYLCRALVPRMPIDAETDWLVRKGSLLQKQCLLLPVAAIAGGLPISSHGSPSIPALSAPWSPEPEPPFLPQRIFPLFFSYQLGWPTFITSCFLCPRQVLCSQPLTGILGPLFQQLVPEVCHNTSGS